MDLYEYPDGSGYEARFTCCGICALMKKLGLYDLTPAMCHLDYTMAEAGGTADSCANTPSPPAARTATAGTRKNRRQAQNNAADWKTGT